MARQVVSYDDLAPASAPLQSASVSSTNNSGGTSQHTAENNSVSPASKRRRREETADESNGAHTVEREADSGRVLNSRNLSSFRSLPPKPQVKRGRNKRRSRRGGGTNMVASVSETPRNQGISGPVQHWDDPGAQADGIFYDDGGEVNETSGNLSTGNLENGEKGESEMDLGDTEDIDDDQDEEEESRELTHEEIWDDSALIAAWDAANEEYEAMHGKTKRWKKERIHKSPLWYNKPPDKPVALSKKGEGKAERGVNGTASTGQDHSHEASRFFETGSSEPLNFETYIPTHDPSLTVPSASNLPSVPQPTHAHLKCIASQYQSMLPATPIPNQHGIDDAPVRIDVAAVGAVNADEAFSRALGAMYWCGYWTAVYHVQRAHEQEIAPTANNLEAENLTEAQEDETVEFVSTQR